MGNRPAVATATSLAEAGRLSTARRGTNLLDDEHGISITGTVRLRGQAALETVRDFLDGKSAFAGLENCQPHEQLPDPWRSEGHTVSETPAPVCF